MDSSDLEKLLEPLSPESPCGEDLEYDPEFGEMERAAQGKAEQQYGETVVAAEPPDWKDVRKRVDSLLERTKDMRVAVYLARCSLQMEGLESFRMALALLRGYVENYWDSVHPELDRSDNDDPTYRMNTLVTLCDEETIVREVREAPLVSSRAMGQFNLRDLERAREAIDSPPPASAEESDGWGDEETAPSEPSGPSMAAIEAAFSDAEVEALQATEEATRLASEDVETIEQIVTERVGAAQAVSLDPLRSVLLEINKVLVAQLERRGVYAGGSESGDSESADADGQDGGQSTAGAIESQAFVNGQIASRDQAIRALDKVCEYYERNEPSSPLPLLIRRAQRLASKSFLEIIRDLAPDAITQAEALGGSGGYAEESSYGGYSEPASEEPTESSSSDW